MRPLESQTGRQNKMDLENGKTVDLLNVKLAYVKLNGSMEVMHTVVREMEKKEPSENMLRNGKGWIEADDAKQSHSDEEENHRQDLSENPKTVNKRSEEPRTISIPVLVQSSGLPLDNLLKNQKNITFPESKSERNSNQSTVAKSKVVKAKLLKESKENIWSIIRKTVLKEYSFLLIPDFLLLLVSFLFLAYGCSVPFVYLVPYSLSAGVSPQQAAFVMSILGVSGIIGTITFGWIADRK